MRVTTLDPFGPLSDADADIAAIFFDDATRPDFLLASFAGELRAADYRVAGYVQSRCRENATANEAVDILTGARVGIPHDAADDHCRPRDVFEQAVTDLCNAISAGVDLVVVNRFGRLESSGRGLWPVIAAAHRRETPLVVAVSEHGREPWLRWSNGMTVHLPCSRPALQGWWTGLGRSRGDRIASRTARET